MYSEMIILDAFTQNDFLEVNLQDVTKLINQQGGIVDKLSEDTYKVVLDKSYIIKGELRDILLFIAGYVMLGGLENVSENK